MEEALISYRKARALCTKISDNTGVAVSCFRIGSIHADQLKTDEAIKDCEKALTYLENKVLPLSIYIKDKLAIANFQQGKLREATK